LLSFAASIGVCWKQALVERPGLIVSRRETTHVHVVSKWAQTGALRVEGMVDFACHPHLDERVVIF
jgi:hypothetical protein